MFLCSRYFEKQHKDFPCISTTIIADTQTLLKAFQIHSVTKALHNPLQLGSDVLPTAFAFRGPTSGHKQELVSQPNLTEAKFLTG